MLLTDATQRFSSYLLVERNLSPQTEYAYRRDLAGLCAVGGRGDAAHNPAGALGLVREVEAHPDAAHRAADASLVETVRAYRGLRR